MRTVAALKNIKSTLLIYGLTLMLQFLIRLVFLHYLTIEYLGLNGLFDNMLAVLSFTELGIGPAIVYSLYGPLARGEVEQVKSIMRLFKKAYIYIGMTIIILGGLLVPWLSFFLKSPPDIPDLSYFYLLFVLDTGISYFYSYKRNLLIADQKQYVANFYKGVAQLVGGTLQIVLLIAFQSFWAYILVRVAMTFLENLAVAKRAEREYPYLQDTSIMALPDSIKQDIVKNVKALILHKVGSIAVFSTSNILLSKYVGLIAVGLYSNYYLVMTAINRLSDQLFNSLKATVGNLNELASKEEKIEVFKKLEFITAWLAYYISINLLVLINPFIEWWVGAQYVLPHTVVILMVLNFYLTFMRKGVNVFKDAMGLFWHNRYMPIVESVINLSLGIWLVQTHEIIGVLIAMTLSTLLMPFLVEPYIVMKYGLRWSLEAYFTLYAKYAIPTVLIAVSSVLIYDALLAGHGIWGMIGFIVCGSLLLNVVWWLLFRTTKEMNYGMQLLRKRLHRT